MSGLFGGGSGSGKGFTEPTTVDIPAFESAGGITPQQTDLADYSYGQNLMPDASLFGTEGIGQSTMATQAAGGAGFQKAQDVGKMSDVNQQAEYQLYQQDLAGLEGNLTTQTTLDQLSRQAADLFTTGLVSGLGGTQGKIAGLTGAKTT